MPSRKVNLGKPDHNATPVQAQVDRALLLLARGESRSAVERLHYAARQDPDNADVHAILSQAHFRLGEFELAENEINHAVRLDPKNPDFRGGLGRILRRNGRPVGAIRSFQQALALQPGHWAARELIDARAGVMQSLPQWHLPMLADVVRNDGFERAINRAVRPDDVVLDIGTGTGLLAMMAARKGARHVYACEMDPILADIAVEIINRNGFSEKITVIPKKSTDLDSLPEPASLLITETFDSMLTGEGCLPSIQHAKQRLLSENARIIPASGHIIGQLVTLPRLKVMHPLQRLNGFDYSALGELALERRLYDILPGREAVVPLTNPTIVATFDFSAPGAFPTSGRTQMTFSAAGFVHALLLWIDLDLDAETALSSAPNGSLHHWKPLAYLLDDAPETRVGDQVDVQWRTDGTALEFMVDSL